MTAQRGESHPGSDVSMTAVPKAARAFHARPAGVVSRLLAAVVDTGVLLLVGGACYLGAAGLLFIWSPRNAHLPDLSRLTIVVALAILALIYLIASWTTSGRTYGDHLLGLRVMGPHHERMQFVRALLRGLICIVFPAGLLWAAVSSSRKSVADLLLNTSVVYDWTERITEDS